MKKKTPLQQLNEDSFMGCCLLPVWVVVMVLSRIALLYFW